MIYLFSILYLSWALWKRDMSLYEFDFDIRLSQSKEKYLKETIIYATWKVNIKPFYEWVELSETPY